MVAGEGANIPAIAPTAAEPIAIKPSGITFADPPVGTGLITIYPAIIITDSTIIPTISISIASTKSQTIIRTSILTPSPDYDAKIAALEKQLAEQNQKIEQQGNILDQIINFLRNVFGWK